MGCRKAGRMQMEPRRLVGAACVGLLLALGLVGCGGQDDGGDDDSPSAAAAGLPTSFEDGVALGIVYDTSGSMSESVGRAGGGSDPKYVIANRALDRIVARLEDWLRASDKSAPRRLETGLVIFREERARTALRFGAFDARALRAWVQDFDDPDGNTPLGRALSRAGMDVLRSRLARKHLLVVTDGESNAGPTPAQILDELRRVAAKQGTVLHAHFVAFDVDAKVFAPLKSSGASVAPAADEAQLAEQLTTILEEQILLER